MSTIDVLFEKKIADLRAGKVSLEDFARWSEDKIEEKRSNADYMLNDCQTEVYLSFAERSARKQRESYERMEESFEMILSFLDGGDEELLDLAMPPLKAAVKGFREALELNEECLEFDGGLDGTI